MKNKLLALFVTLIVCICAFPLPMNVFADGEVTVEYNKYEAIVVGEPIDIKAQVTRNGETKEESIKYTSFDVLLANELFRTFAVKGYIDGYELPIEQNVIVIPANLVYMINAGSNSLNKEIVSGSEILGSELDHTGENSQTEPYFEAIKRKATQLHNKQGSKQYGVNVEEAGDWGYVGSNHLAKSSLTNNQKNPFGMIMYPTRNMGTDVEFRMSIADGSYDLYIGTYSHWFARQVNILINGNTAFSQYEIKPVNEIARVSAVSPVNGEIKVTMQGKTLYEEAMVSFIAITPHQEVTVSELSAPVVDNVMSPDQAELEVSGLTVGAKLQLYSYDNNLLIKEFVTQESQMTVEFDADMMNVSRFFVRQIVGEVASNGVFVQRTDISGMKCEFNPAYVGDKVAVNVTANSLSGIASVKLELNGKEVFAQNFADLNNNNFNYLLEVSENGKYTVTLTSGVGAVSISEFVIGNIDDKQLALDCKFDLASAKLSGEDKIVLSLSKVSGSPLTAVAYGKDGKFTNVDLTAKTVEIKESGVYTFYAENQVGKTDAVVRIISLSESDYMTVDLTRTQDSGALVVNFVSKNGYQIKTVQVFKVDSGMAERLNVNGTKCNVYDNATYFASITNEDGTVEICKFVVSEIAGYGAGQKQGCFSALATTSVLCSLGLIACAYVIVKRRK